MQIRSLKFHSRTCLFSRISMYKYTIARNRNYELEGIREMCLESLLPSISNEETIEKFENSILCVFSETKRKNLKYIIMYGRLGDFNTRTSKGVNFTCKKLSHICLSLGFSIVKISINLLFVIRVFFSLQIFPTSVSAFVSTFNQISKSVEIFYFLENIFIWMKIVVSLIARII